MEQKDLIRRAQSGDSKAQGALYESMYKRVYYLALRLTRTHEDAQDAAQEAFVAAFQALPGLENPDAFEGWLFQITANKCRNILRKNGRLTELSEDGEGHTLLDALVDPDEALIPEAVVDSAEKRKLFLELIDGLPEHQRECVLLFYYAELSVKQIAQMLDCSEGTVKSRLNYARRKLQEGILAVEERDDIRRHVLVPIGVLFARDLELTTAGLACAALGGAAVGAAGGGAAAGSGAVKTGLFAAVKVKVIAGITAAAVAVGGGAVVVSRLPRTVAFTDPAMEQNIRVLLDRPSGRITTADLDEVYSLELFDNGMALTSWGSERATAVPGTMAVESLADLAGFPHLNALYYTGADTDLLGTLAEGTRLQTLMFLGRDDDLAMLSEVSFVDRLPKLRQLNVGVMPDTDLSPVERCTSLQELSLWSTGALRLRADNLTHLFSLNMNAGWNGVDGGAANELVLTGPLPELRTLWILGGRISSLEFLAHTPELLTLDLYGENAGDWDLTPIGGLEKLRAVMLVGGYGQRFDLTPLAGCPALEVCQVPNGESVNFPPQAVMDTEGSMPEYNRVSLEVQKEVDRLMFGRD